MNIIEYKYSDKIRRGSSSVFCRFFIGIGIHAFMEAIIKKNPDVGIVPNL